MGESGGWLAIMHPIQFNQIEINLFGHKSLVASRLQQIGFYVCIFTSFVKLNWMHTIRSRSCLAPSSMRTESHFDEWFEKSIYMFFFSFLFYIWDVLIVSKTNFLDDIEQRKIEYDKNIKKVERTFICTRAIVYVCMSVGCVCVCNSGRELDTPINRRSSRFLDAFNVCCCTVEYNFSSYTIKIRLV